MDHTTSDQMIELTTHRGTRVQMIQHPDFGMTCYMDELVQSSESDEAVYHQALVSGAMRSVPHARRALILGGGEGATAREVLRSTFIEHVDMVEWDRDVIALFRDQYPQWGKFAWTDPRLHLHTEDAFTFVETLVTPYDVIVVDLFDPEEGDLPRWVGLVRALERILAPNGAIVMYTGMYELAVLKTVYDLLSETVNCLPNHSRVPYRVAIPSFEGESTFLLFRPPWI
jgi:spermidine synthase